MGLVPDQSSLVFVMGGHGKKVAVHRPGGWPHRNSAGRPPQLGHAAPRAVGGKFLFREPPSVRCFVTTAELRRSVSSPGSGETGTIVLQRDLNIGFWI